MISDHQASLMKVKLPIKLKILGVVLLVMTIGLSVYIYLAVETFEKDKTELIYDLTRGDVGDVASEMEGSLRSTANTFQLFSQSYADLGAAKTKDIFKGIIESDPLLVDIGIYKKNNDGQFQPQVRLNQKSFLDMYSLGGDFFENINGTPAQIPFDRVKSETVVAWNGTLPGSPPLLGFGIKIVNRADGGRGSQIVLFGQHRLGQPRFRHQAPARR